MSVDDNKRVVQRAFDSMSEGRETFEAEHDEIYSPDLVGHFSGMPPVDIEMHRMFGLATFDAFSDLKRPVEALVAEGDKVVARWTSVGTHDGPFQGIPPTGKTVDDHRDHDLPARGREDRGGVERVGHARHAQQLGAIPSGRADGRTRTSDRARSVTSVWSARGRIAGCAAVERGPR